MDKSEYKRLLIGIYFNTVKELYSYTEMMDFLSLNYKQLTDLLSKLIVEEFLVEEKIIKLTKKGIDYLNELGLTDINFFELFSIEPTVNQYLQNAKSVDEVYLPKNFDKKFKGY